MKKLWNRFLMWVGIRKVNPHNLTAADVSLENVKQSEIAGRPAVFRSTPPERGPLEKVPPRKPNGRVATSISSSPTTRYVHEDSITDVLATALVVNELTGMFQSDERSEPVTPEPVVVVPESTPTPVQSSSWDARSAVDPEPGSWDGGTRFDNPTTTTFDGGGDGFFKSVGDAISGIGDAVSDATSSWSD